MSRNIWVISDTHVNHANIIKYCNRPFATVQLMNEAIMENWNSVVNEGDIVYHLGDVYMSKNGDDMSWYFAKLKGSKRLILGNHDDGKDKVLLQAFKKIMVWRYFKEFGLLLTHVPVHEGTLDSKKFGPLKTPKVGVNVHGHTHQHIINDRRYKNVCVEHTNYTPVNIEELRVK